MLFRSIKGHVVSIVIIGIAMVACDGIAEFCAHGLTGQDLDAMFAFDMAAVAAMSWHAYSLAVSLKGMNVTQYGPRSSGSSIPSVGVQQ